MAGTLAPLAKEGFVVCAPKSTAATWDTGDIEKVKEIVRHLMATLSVEEGRLHGMGFSNGGWNLAPLVFDEKLRFASACWVAAGYNGGKVPKRARTELGAMALAGSEDGNRGAAEKTVDLLADKVRCVECRLQKGLGHEFPREHLPYYFYWVKVMDGRYEPGIDMSFAWSGDPVAAKADMAARKLGGFFYFHSTDDAGGEEGRRVQHEVFFDPLVRRFGGQLVAVKLDRASHAELFASLDLKTTPAVAVLAPDGKPKKTFEGKAIKESALAKALREFAPDKSVPK
jgi:hypothetical protein